MNEEHTPCRAHMPPLPDPRSPQIPPPELVGPYWGEQGTVPLAKDNEGMPPELVKQLQKALALGGYYKV